VTAARVAIVTLGCGRNEADSDHLGGALEAAGFALEEEPAAADCVVVNTCTFIEAARRESVETILEACAVAHAGGEGPPVLVVGCMAERYGAELAAALPEVAGVHGFADYDRLPDLLREVLGHGGGHPAARPHLPLVTTAAPARAAAPAAPPTVAFPLRTEPRGPWAYLKIAGGCDRRCTFCTIPSYRGRFASRPLHELVAEARWLVERGVRELVCVSENTTSYGKDTPAGRAAQGELIAAFEGVEGLERVRFAYLQPDELTDELLERMAASPVVASYYDLSLQHASGRVLASMARSGDAERFLALVTAIRERDRDAVFRSSFIVGFPGESEDDVDVLAAFLDAAGIDWPGFFVYSAEDGTPSAALPGQVPADEARARRDHLLEIADLVADERARAFVGREVSVLVEGSDGGAAVGRSHREAPETDGEVRLPGLTAPAGALVRARVLAADGVDLVAEPTAAASPWQGAAHAGRGR
jgi:ribosomal protein S12 methylthiotransferase